MLKKVFYYLVVTGIFCYLAYIGYELYIDVELKLFSECTSKGHVQLVDESNGRVFYVECNIVMGEEKSEVSYEKRHK
ncbi:hypothetical protein [Pseudoalteromonas obscura]|uniref:TMhelix containing protein n=1 Tax=Pseudoalteromonas obscura TaxID=3048491 RepID=A0ABT7EK61_9GAMM|nr:hypothetical protein [Pseudoalteromonas sp. P94(2023)]MDK2595397.1 hypothetical protein [Pseudoalteromonas sp. P94(2023)]